MGLNSGSSGHVVEERQLPKAASIVVGVNMRGFLPGICLDVRVENPTETIKKLLTFERTNFRPN